jgi:hypothetical protein
MPSPVISDGADTTMILLAGKDKLYHMAACALITIATLLGLLLSRRIYHRYCPSGVEKAGAVDGCDDVEAPPANKETESIQASNTEKCNFDRFISKNWVLVTTSSLVALLIGIAKEIGDMYNIWWLCQAKNADGSIVGCDASWADLLADIVGIILANVIIFASLWMWKCFKKKTRSTAEYAIASSTDT